MRANSTPDAFRLKTRQGGPYGGDVESKSYAPPDLRLPTAFPMIRFREAEIPS